MKFKNIVIIGALTAALTGCGGDGGDLSATGDASGVLASISGVVSNQLVTAMAQQPGNIPAAPGGMPSLLATPFDGCLTYEIGSANTDAHYKIKYDCRKVTDGADKKDWIGTFEQKYTDAATKDAEKGFFQEMDLTYVIYTNGSTTDYSKDVHKGYYKFTAQATKLVYENDYSLDMEMPTHNPPYDWTWRNQKKSVYTPDDMNNAFAAGSVTHEGFFQIKGLLGGNGPGTANPEINLTFEVSSKGLKYDATCNNYYKEGSIYLTDGSGNKAEIQYQNDCTTIKYLFNGKEWDF